MMEIFNLEQGTPEWHQARCGVITASEMKNVIASGRGNAESKTRRKYMLVLAAEIITGEPCVAFEGNEHTERGHVQEPIARQLYQDLTGNNVEQVGFIKQDRVGVSPDGLVGDEGGIEIKSKLPHLHLEALLADRIPPEHVAQLQTFLWVTGREWIDFVSYCPGLPIFVKREEPDIEYQKMLESRCGQFCDELDTLVDVIMGKY